MTKLYLAGPDVFYPQAIALGEAKKQLCAEYGFEGLFPLDNQIALEGLAPAETARAILNTNVELMDQSDAIAVNMTPFRGPGMDNGSAFEMGYFHALEKPLFGYSLVSGDYAARVTPSATNPSVDPDGMEIENFGLADNLMMSAGIIQSGGDFIEDEGEPLDSEAHLRAFTRLLQRISAYYQAKA